MVEDSEFVLCQRITFWVWKVYGIWTTEDQSLLYRAFFWIYHFFFTFAYIFAMFLSSFFTDNSEELWREVMFMLLTEAAMCTKQFYLIRNFAAILRLNRISVSMDYSVKTDHDLKAQTRMLNRCNTVMLVFFLFSISSVLGNVALLFGDSYKLPYSNWFYWVPLGKNHQTNYYIMFAYQIFGMVCHCALNVVADIHVIYLLSVVSFQLDLLLEDLARLPIPSSRTYIEKQLYRQTFVEHIEKYDRIHSFVREVEHIFSVPVFIQIGASGITICAVMFALSSMDITDLRSSVPMLCYLVAMLLQIYLPCMFGNEVTFKSHHLTNAIFSSDWYKLPVPERKDLMRLMLRTSKPFILKAGDYFHFSLQTFGSTLNTAYSIYAVLNRRNRTV
ncbi:odorant receptor 94a-like [Malaya genurostris]|uniref:odorant receptor 94a-like n=1 Tax=Malaya genurostris TaxID=325434 RepID=UPI0026F3804C|nr:odorant receptor 94a-like [Malaya genurostris]